MKTFFTSDLHIGHKNISKFCPDSRGQFETVEEMNEAIVDGMNAAFSGESSRLIILGDICMGNLQDSLSWLAKIEADELVLLPGNHDRWSLAYHHKGDASAKRSEFINVYSRALEGRAVIFQDHAPSSWEGLFSLTGDWNHAVGPLSEVSFSHYPYAGGGDSHGEERYDWLRPKDEGFPLIHGHIHQERTEEGRMLNVGVDAPGRGFNPWSEEELVAWIETL